MTSAGGEHSKVVSEAWPNGKSMRIVPVANDGLITRSNRPEPVNNDRCMWVFGYGSLIWKVDFPVQSRLVGYIKGYHRRFWQLSEDHRGVPGAPGRVVTLVEADDHEERVWGVAYEIAEHDVDSVNSHLDYREKGGYSRLQTLFYPATPPSVDARPFPIFLYIGLKENSMYSELSEAEIAKQIHRAVGPSGANYEYLSNLADSLRNLCPDVSDEVRDDHVFMLEKLVRGIRTEEESLASSKVTTSVISMNDAVPGGSKEDGRFDSISHDPR